MNLFFLSFIYEDCASFHCDKHCVKMILEATQLLYTCQHLNRYDDEWIEKRNKKYLLKNKTPLKVYKPAYRNHPTAIWVRTSIHNYKFTVVFALYLCLEYTKRFEKQHACQAHLLWLVNNIPPFTKVFPYKEGQFLASKNLKKNLTPIPLAMPPQYYKKDPVKAYRLYYISDKRDIAKWSYSEKPDWFK